MGSGAAPGPPAGFRGLFRTDLAARHVYAQAAGIGHLVPQAVAAPLDPEDLARLVRWASASGMPLTPRGSGSSMAGGAIGPGVVVDVSRWRDLDEVDAARGTVRVQAGALRNDVDAAARRVGMRFPVDPSSGAFCTVGGMAATNAAGARSMRFGATASWVRGVECVFADGSTGTLRRGVPASAGTFRSAIDDALGQLPRVPDARAVRKESSGYAMARYRSTGDIVDLLIGSEGTLAFFTALELALAPLPGATHTLLGVFATLEDAAGAAVHAREAGAAACELLDRTFLDIAGRRDIPAGAEAVLIADVEGPDAPAAQDAGRALERSFREHGALETRGAPAGTGATELWEIRHAASPALKRLDEHLRSMQFIEDGAVPPARLPDYVRGVRAALERQDMRGVIFGHAGDGHVHVNPLVDVRRPDWRRRVETLLDDVTMLVSRLEGTLAGEHGDGRLRAPLLRRSWSPVAVEGFAAVKRCFDPAGILNPGVKVPTPGQRPIEGVKYDPALPALDPLAAAALALVDDQRRYDAFRLALL